MHQFKFGRIFKQSIMIWEQNIKKENNKTSKANEKYAHTSKYLIISFILGFIII